MFYAKRVHRLVLNEVTIKKEERDFLLRRHRCAPLLPELRVLLIADGEGDSTFGLGCESQDTYMAEHLVVLFLSTSLCRLAISVRFTYALDWGRIASRCPSLQDICIGFSSLPSAHPPRDHRGSIDYDPKYHYPWELPWGYKVTKHGKGQPSHTPALRDAICQWTSLTKLAITGQYEPLPPILEAIAKLPSLAHLVIFNPTVDDAWPEDRSSWLPDAFPALRELSLRPATPTAALFIFLWPGLLYRVIALRWDSDCPEIVASSGFQEAIIALGQNAMSLQELHLHFTSPAREVPSPGPTPSLQAICVTALQVSNTAHDENWSPYVSIITGASKMLKTLRIDNVVLPVFVLSQLQSCYPALAALSLPLAPTNQKGRGRIQSDTQTLKGTLELSIDFEAPSWHAFEAQERDSYIEALTRWVFKRYSVRNLG